MEEKKSMEESKSMEEKKEGTNSAEEAVGLLEVFGLTCAFLAADAGCKAADVTLETFDKNKPANADALPVPLLVTVKFRGSVAAVEAARGGGKIPHRRSPEAHYPQTHRGHRQNAENQRI